MPFDAFFGFHVTIGSQTVPEYVKGDVVYVESNLWTRVSYKQTIRELVQGEVEEQQWPVTPYKVEVEAKASCPQSWYFLYVDGVLAGRAVLKATEKRVFDGFPTEEGTREFLFALPRFASDEDDRVDPGRKSKVGTIEVERKVAEFTHSRHEVHDGWKIGDYSQANKKDSHDITKGEYTMPTTKEGKLVAERRKPRAKTVHCYNIGAEQGSVCVHYRMGHTLQEMGIALRGPGDV